MMSEEAQAGSSEWRLRRRNRRGQFGVCPDIDQTELQITFVEIICSTPAVYRFYYAGYAATKTLNNRENLQRGRDAEKITSAKNK